MKIACDWIYGFRGGHWEDNAWNCEYEAYVQWRLQDMGDVRTIELPDRIWKNGVKPASEKDFMFYMYQN